MLPSFKITAAACIFGALALMILPLRWLLALMIAAAVHELFHCIALKVCGIPIHSVTIDFGGAVIETGEIAPGMETICALAGPVGSFSLLLLAQWMPLTALFGAVQGIYNLLPIYPMDGGRALRSLLELIFPLFWEKIYGCLELMVMAVLAIGGIMLVVVTKAWSLTPFLLLIPARKIIQRKIPCKDGR